MITLLLSVGENAVSVHFIFMFCFDWQCIVPCGILPLSFSLPFQRKIEVGFQGFCKVLILARNQTQCMKSTQIMIIEAELEIDLPWDQAGTLVKLLLIGIMRLRMKRWKICSEEHQNIDSERTEKLWFFQQWSNWTSRCSERLLGVQEGMMQIGAP